MKEDQTQLAVTPSTAAKKAYRNPEFVIYGDVRHMTQTVGATGVLDGGGGANNKTNGL